MPQFRLDLAGLLSTYANRTALWPSPLKFLEKHVPRLLKKVNRNSCFEEGIKQTGETHGEPGPWSVSRLQYTEK
ncbi:hypothetical protein CU097_003552, partial [Rhizopus azygosporus]